MRHTKNSATNASPTETENDIWPYGENADSPFLSEDRNRCTLVVIARLSQMSLHQIS